MAVIGSFQSVGTLLVFGLLVGPPATAALLSRTIPRMIVYSILIASASVWFGLVLSYHLGTAGSATMALVPVVAFFLTLTWKRLRGSGGNPSNGRPREAGALDAGSKDAALVLELEPGIYTAQISGVGDSTATSTML